MFSRTAQTMQTEFMDRSGHPRPQHHESLPSAADPPRHLPPGRGDERTAPRTAGPRVGHEAEGRPTRHGRCAHRGSPPGGRSWPGFAPFTSAKILARLLLSVVLPFSTGAAPAEAGQATTPSVVYVVRHAERADTAAPSGRSPQVPPQQSSMISGADPDLSPAGRARAQRLASLLRDAAITRIITSEYQRTRQTARPLAEQAEITAQVVPANDLDGLIRLIDAATDGPVLVIGHSNTVPELLSALGHDEPVGIGDDEFDHLFVVIRTQRAPVVVLRLRY